MRIFDANLMLGRLGIRPIGVEDADDMLAVMDGLGIERGFVSHIASCIHSTELGNSILLEKVKGKEGRLIPVPVVNLRKGWEGEIPGWKDAGVRALRVVPAFYGYSLAGGEGARLAEVASELGWPVIVTIEAVRGIPWRGGELREAIAFAKRFPRVRVLASGINRTHLQSLCPALSSTGNLYIEVANLQTAMALEQLVELGLDGQVLCGTDYGMSCPGVAIDRIRLASIPERSKEKILHRNAGMLLGESPKEAR